MLGLLKKLLGYPTDAEKAAAQTKQTEEAPYKVESPDPAPVVAPAPAVEAPKEEKPAKAKTEKAPKAPAPKKAPAEKKPAAKKPAAPKKSKA